MPKGNRTNHPTQTSTSEQRYIKSLSKGGNRPLRKKQDPEDEVDEESPEYYSSRQYLPAHIDIPYKEGDWKRDFLIELAKFPNIAQACRVAQISRVYATKLRRENKKFAELWDECLQSALDQLEQVVFERSLNPWDPASATLSKWLLTTHRPEVYNQAQHVKHDHELHTRDDKPVKIQVETIDYRNFLGAIAPADRALIEGEKVKDIEDDDLFDDFREILEPEA